MQAVMGQSRSESRVDELQKERYDGSESLKRSVPSPGFFFGFSRVQGLGHGRTEKLM